ncbi:TPA: lamin tail domain-containing protein, partial [Pseudomonas aeruginosa]
MHPLRNAALLGGLALLGLPVANAAELIISEYVEGSGNNKALEFYNSGSQVLDLSAYRVEFYFNGASAAGRSIDLSGSLAPGKTFVLANGVADPALLALASQRVEGSWFNGNDAVLLRRRSGEILDSLGQVGFNPGTTWGSGDVQTLDRSLVRKADIRDGDSDPSDAFDPAAQWLGYPRDTFANLGQHGAGEPGGGEEAGLRPIHEVQGAGAESPLVNQRVAIEGVVVGDFQNASELKGFYVQQEDATVDGDPATSEGIFVYDGGNGSDVKLGDRVRVTGQVREFNGLTELVGPLQVSVLASGVALPTPAGISLPLASADALERYEGMRVQLRQTLTVNEVYNLGRYGEVLLSSGGRQMTPTNVVAPGEQAKAMQARNDLDRILLDDGRSGQNPDPIRYPAPELSAYNSLRVGDRTSAIDGVLDYSAGSYRIQPLQTPTFEAANPRPAQPAVEGRLRVASFNVLNYFNGDGKGGGFPTSRGANTAEEFQR